MKKRKYIRRLWTEKECEVMLSMFADNYTIDVCKILNRTYGSICSQANIMNLKKSDEFRSMELQRQADRLKVVGAKFRYAKGREPENKGKPMSKELYDKCKATMFKKGNEPHNTCYDGHERISTEFMQVPNSGRLLSESINLYFEYDKIILNFESKPPYSFAKQFFYSLWTNHSIEIIKKKIAIYDRSVQGVIEMVGIEYNKMKNVRSKRF